MARQALLDRWVMKVDTSGDCWLWTGALDRYGYGKFASYSRTLIAHRVGYELLVEPIEAGLDLDHLCHERDTGCAPSTCLHRRCVNPDHLEPVTRLAHVRRTSGSETHCLRGGHEYTAENTYRKRNGSRECRTCRAQLRHSRT